MSKEINIHPVQISILRVLLFKPKARFSELNVTKITNDHFNFHINKLLQEEILHKDDMGLYELTVSGKELANRLDTDALKIERQAKVAVMVIPQKVVDGETFYLCQRRLKQPCFGFYGFVTGKIRWGEVVSETAARELFEETGLSASFQLKAIEHKIDYSKNEDLLEDKFFFVFTADSIEGALVEEFEGGENLWLTEEQIHEIPNKFGDVKICLEACKSSGLEFIEEKYSVTGY